MINVAMVGLGWWGRHIVGCLRNNRARLRVTRGIDIAPDAHRDFADANEFDLSADLSDALDDPGIDAVLLATPHSLHEAQIVAAAEAGKHVFCEKPLALTKASAERAVAACAAAGVQLGVGHERRFEPAFREIKRLIDEGALGEIQHAESNFSHDRLADVPAEGWRADADESPAAGMTATGIHHSDAYLWMLGDITEVFAQTARRYMRHGAGDVLSIQFRHASGATSYFSSQLATPLYMRFAVFGSKAWVEARGDTHPSEIGKTRLTVSRAEGVEETAVLDDIDTVTANLEAFADAVEGRAGYPFTDEEKIRNAAVLEAVVGSAESGRPVTV